MELATPLEQTAADSVRRLAALPTLLQVFYFTSPAKPVKILPLPQKTSWNSSALMLNPARWAHQVTSYRNFCAVRAANSFKACLKLSSKCVSAKATMYNSSNAHARGALIVLEGLDCCGKTTQCSKLVSFLKGEGLPVEAWRFPDRNTDIGKMISLYLANRAQLDDQTVHLLFSANRWEKRSLMEGKLRNGTTLVVDRYSYSGVSFSAAKGLDIEWCKAPEKGLIAPDLVVYLDISPEEAAKRGGYGTERYEHLEFQRNVARYYQILHDATWKIIDACQPSEIISQQIEKLALDSVIASQNKPLLSL